MGFNKSNFDITKQTSEFVDEMYMEFTTKALKNKGEISKDVKENIGDIIVKNLNNQKPWITKDYFNDGLLDLIVYEIDEYYKSEIIKEFRSKTKFGGNNIDFEYWKRNLKDKLDKFILEALRKERDLILANFNTTKEPKDSIYFKMSEKARKFFKDDSNKFQDDMFYKYKTGDSEVKIPLRAFGVSYDESYAEKEEHYAKVISSIIDKDDIVKYFKTPIFIIPSKHEKKELYVSYLFVNHGNDMEFANNDEENKYWNNRHEWYFDMNKVPKYFDSSKNN